MLKQRLTLAAACLLAGLAVTASAVAQDRLPQAIAPNAPRTAIPHTVFARARSATDLGAAPADTRLNSLSLRFSLTDAQTRSLDQLLSDQQNPSSPRYHQWLTPEQYAASYGLSATDLETASAWLKAQGFTVTGTARSHSFISFSGTAAQVSQAFGTQLHRLSSRGETHLSNLTDPVLPAPLANVVLGVTGLNDFRIKPHARARTTSARPAYYGGASNGNFIAPADFNTIYNIKPLLASSVNGTGITIAVLGQTDIDLSNVTAFRNAAALPTNLPTVRLYGADPGTSDDDVPEAMIDVEWAGAIAPNASILYVNGEDIFGNSMTQAIDNNVAPIITVSYGNCEVGFGTTYIAQFNALFKQANAQGQTILGPSGDSGAADCDYTSTYAVNGLNVDFPASSPYVTAVGGTEFNEGSGAYWSTTNGTGGSTALSYIPEQPWNETYDTTSSGTFFGLKYGGSGGGGVSQVFAKPSWQIGTGVPADSSRDVPDISFSASAEHDGYLVCSPVTTNNVSAGSCVNGFANAAGDYTTIYGGTSVSTPAFAGILALLEQQLGGVRVGNVNPTLYGLANSTYYNTVFHDVTSGTNTVPCTLGSTDCVAGDADYHAPNTVACPANSCSGNIAYDSIGYNAATGYDLASGWGSMDISNMVADWLLVTPAGGTSTTGTAASSATLSTATPSVIAGAVITLNASVFSATTTSKTNPTGTVQLLIDNTNTGSPVTLASGGATLTFDTTGLTSGTHVLAISYSGDTTYAGTKATAAIDITSTSTADFSVSPATTTVTVASGQTAAGVTYTITPTGGFTGAVSFTAATTSSTLNASYEFVPPTVNITSTAAGTTVLTLSAFTTPTTQGAHRLSKHLASTDPRSLTGWGIVGSSITLAGLFLIRLPRRNSRWSGLLLAFVSVGVLSTIGCSGDKGTAVTPSQINTAPGTYNLTVTASGTNASGATVSHTVALTFVVQ